MKKHPCSGRSSRGASILEYLVIIAVIFSTCAIIVRHFGSGIQRQFLISAERLGGGSDSTSPVGWGGGGHPTPAPTVPPSGTPTPTPTPEPEPDLCHPPKATAARPWWCPDRG